jgi:hypothetical protein
MILTPPWGRRSWVRIQRTRLLQVSLKNQACRQSKPAALGQTLIRWGIYNDLVRHSLYILSLHHIPHRPLLCNLSMFQPDMSCMPYSHRENMLMGSSRRICSDIRCSCCHNIVQEGMRYMNFLQGQSKCLQRT